jgi:hypothetical protein
MKISIVLLGAVAAVAAQESFTATGVGCEPHNDHWHCPEGVAEPTTAPAAEATIDTVVATASGVCEPHKDHWHCPEGVAEPTTPPPTSAAAATTPAASATASHDHDHDDDDDDHDHDHAVTASTCQPHGDHWHCPSGVAEPTAAPAQSSGSAAATATPSGSSSPSGAAATQSVAAAVAIGATQQGVVAAVLGAVGVFFL